MVVDKIRRLEATRSDSKMPKNPEKEVRGLWCLLINIHLKAHWILVLPRCANGWPKFANTHFWQSVPNVGL